MKTYWSIPGPSKAPQGPCIAFYKYDGSNLRFEWTRKRGWWKYGTRMRLFDENDPEYGEAVGIFNETYADDIEDVLRTNKNYRGVEKVTVFCEFYGPSSFAGWHVWEEAHELMLFDVEIHKKGFVLPRAFVDDFGHLKSADVIYEGNCTRQFVEDVKNGQYPVAEGVVCKGVITGKKKSEQHGLWMAKVKTRRWIEELKRRAAKDLAFRRALQENLQEQAG